VKQVKINCRDFLPQMLRQAGIMVLLAVVLGVLSNSFRQERIPLAQDWSSQARLEQGADTISEISLEEARKAFLSGRAVFLDARFPVAYREGHIRGAYNLPWESVEQLADGVLADIPRDIMIITYCDGKNCDLSMNLARELFFRGYENVRVLVNGWTRWKGAGLPVSQGDGP
jgi:rhodanese-related sulfurtransferase